MHSAPLISPENREHNRSHAQKDPTLVYHDGEWRLFMTVKLQERTAIEHCSFADWDKANDSKRTLLDLSDSDYFCAPQIFYFRPQELWYLVYQVGIPKQKKMWVAYSTTKTIDAPASWTKARPMLDGGANDPRTVGGLDYWIICDDTHAYLFFTSLNGRMWRLRTTLEQFPNGFDDCQLALSAEIFEASHTYRVLFRKEASNDVKYLTIIEENGKRYFKAYIADRLDGEWRPLADTFKHPFASEANVNPEPGVRQWTDNVSHGELIRAGNDERLEIDPEKMQFVFQGMLQKDKNSKSYGAFNWRIGLLTPQSATKSNR